MVRLLLSVLLLNAPYPADADIYNFKGDTQFDARVLEIRHTFFLYAADDPAAPKVGAGNPSFIKFHGLVPSSKSGASVADLERYEGLQVSLIRHSKIGDIIDGITTDVGNPHFCDNGKLIVKKPGQQPGVPGFALATSTANNDVNVITARLGAQNRDVRLEVKESGSYYLVVSNCGELKGVSLSGSIIIKGAHGFLPANEYGRLPFYQYLLVFYLLISCFWLALSVRWWKELFQIQYMIGGVMVIGGLECLLWYAYLEDWNNSGTKSEMLLKMAVIGTVCKRALSLILCYAAALGWGMTIPFFPEDIKSKTSNFAAIFIVCGTFSELILTTKHECEISLLAAFGSWLPSGLCVMVMSYWIFVALGDQIAKLKERKQPEKLQLFQRLGYILVFSGVAFVLTTFLSVFDLMQGRQYWAWSWFLVDGVPHCVYALLLVVMMILWRPDRHSLVYAFSAVKGYDVEDSRAGGDRKSADAEAESKAIWADPTDADGDDKESFWDTMGGPKLADTKTSTPSAVSLGATSQEKPKAKGDDLSL